MKYLMVLSLLVGLQAKADYVQEQPAPRCFQLNDGSSIMKLEYEYKLGYVVKLIVGDRKPIKKYMTKIFINSHASQFVEIDCEAFFWGL